MTVTTTDPDQSRGLYGKYRVEKINGKPVGRCFVLDYDNDPHAREALEAYADSCEDEFPQLAADLRRELGIDETIHEADITPELKSALEQHYRGLWVAIANQSVVSSAPTLAKLLNEIIPDGYDVLVFRVPAEGDPIYDR